MQGAVLYGPHDVRFTERKVPTIIEPTDAIVRASATCVCGSDLWPYRGIEPITGPTPMGQQLAREFGATDIVTERGDEGVARVKEMTDGLGAHSVIEAVGAQESMMQAIRSTRPGGHVGFVGSSRARLHLQT